MLEDLLPTGKFGQFLWDESEFELSPIKVAKIIKNKLSELADALLQKGNKLMRWIDRITNSLRKRAKKDVRKLKGQPPELSSWQIIKLLA